MPARPDRDPQPLGGGEPHPGRDVGDVGGAQHRGGPAAAAAAG